MKKRDRITGKRDRVMRDMSKKKDLTDKILNKNKSQKEDLNKEKVEKNIENEKKIRDKIQEHFMELEKQRLEEQKRSHERCNLLFFYDLI